LDWDPSIDLVSHTPPSLVHVNSMCLRLTGACLYCNDFCLQLLHEVERT